MPRRTHGGRPMRGFQSTSAALQQLAELSREWARSVGKLLAGDSKSVKCAKGAKTNVKQALAALDGLSKACKAARSRLKALADR